MTQPQKVMLLSGPNLDLLGEREPAIYGSNTLDEIVASTVEVATTLNLEVEHRQSAREADLVSYIHNARDEAAAIVINPAAFTHYAWSIHDALSAFDGVVVELHLSNPHAREDWRRVSVISPAADAVICGLGAYGYEVAMRAVATLLER
ncbi:MAG: 3-dehydroquinate dehydratase [Acidobacteria bacterium]|nr:3-dehydroquinate dehydratase [Acidobacteriota bacterium]